MDLIQIEGFKVVMNVKQREGRGGKPAVIINEHKYHIIEVCPNLITVPIEVEAVWVVIHPKNLPKNSPFKFIAVCSFYYAGQKMTPRDILYDHMSESFNILTAKFGENTQFIICADSNKLNLSPILDLSPSLKQVVKVPTRLNPDSILDTIITTLSSHYNDPITKPPLANDPDNPRGKPSDHLIVFWSPISCVIDEKPREYRTISFRPIPDSGLSLFNNWIKCQTWEYLYGLTDIDEKTEFIVLKNRRIFS